MVKITLVRASSQYVVCLYERDIEWFNYSRLLLAQTAQCSEEQIMDTVKNQTTSVLSQGTYSYSSMPHFGLSSLDNPF
jgi:exoribonuclease R